MRLLFNQALPLMSVPEKSLTTPFLQCLKVVQVVQFCNIYLHLKVPLQEQLL